MPADIRNFFGGGGPIPAAPANGQNSTNITKLAKKQRGRRVVDDSEDEEVEPKPPKSMQSRKTVKKEIVEPKVEETTSTEYFASNGKSRPSRLTPSRPKSEQPKTAASSYTESPAKGKRPVVSRGSTGRRAARPPSKNYADAESDEVAPLLEDDGDSGEELYAGDIKRNGRTDDDDYDEGSEDDLKLKAKTTNGLNGHPIKQEKKNLEPRGGVLDMADVPSLDGTRDEWPKRGTAPPKAKPGRKRKSKELEQDDDNDFVEEEDDAPKKKSRKPSEKPVAKKPRTSAKNEELDESKGIQAILDTIPTVRAPTPPPRDETKKFNFAQYQNSAAPPPLAGTREMPTGAENCLAGLTFVFTGVLESISREEGQALVKRYGGKTTAGPSSRTSYVVLGNDAGPKKLETIAKLQLKTINEEGLFELIKRLPANGGDSKAAEKHAEKKAKEEQAIRQAAAEMEKEESRATKVMTAQGKTTIPVASPTNKSAPAASSFEATVDSRLWTEKYAPLNIRSVIGNKTLIEKLQRWLRNWHRNAKYGFKQAGSDGVGIYRAAMLHGPPGIGKTTAAHLVAKLEGYDLVESNASDTRSKKLVETGLRGVLDTTSLLGYFAGDRKKVEASKRKLVLIMDEVDGMSAGDRGGVGALAAIAKKTSIPMILICNERRLPKMRPFDHVTADFPFRRPTTDQIRARIMTICFREKIKLPPPILDALIEGSHADIRQIINMISTVKLDDQAMDFDDGKAMSKAWEKHIILKPWDIVGKILSSQMFAPSSKATLNDKIELYFNDHEFSYLMLQENYLKTQPAGAASYQGRERNLKLLEMADKAAGSISDGDLVDRMIHGAQQQWSLMPTHAVFSFVRPASYVYGNFTERPGFVSWLGQNSKYGKLSRFVKEIQGHMRLRASGDRHEIRQQYIPALWQKTVKALNDEGKESVPEVIDLMDSYFLSKEDFDSMVELGVGPMAEENIKIESQTKATFTRLYNAAPHPMPFMKASSVVAPKAAKKVKPDLEDALDESEGEEEIPGDEETKEDEEEQLDLKKDKYIKAPKKKAAPKDSGGDTKPTISKRKRKSKKGKDEDEDEEQELDASDDDEPVKKSRKSGGARGGRRGKTKG